ncbi:MAG: cobalamin biosynthesis protein [Betaproteobacteria bacterium]|nr:cobalamin biosynthesis protein [Betaproteobacteria bacterium]
MNFLAILVALALEQWRPANWRGGVERFYVGYLHWLEARMIHWGAWPATAAALLPALPVLAVSLLAAWFWPVMLVWSFLALYLLMGFRRFSHAVTEITESLQNGDLPTARRALYGWQGGDSQTLGSDDIAQRVIEVGALAAYRCVFGVVFWFLIFGAAGAALYWMLALMAREWSENTVGEDITVLTSARAELGRVARWLLFVLDWLPIRLLAFSFAIVGDFEDAVYQWRAQRNDDAAFDNATNENVLLAATYGALGLTWTRRASPRVVKPAEAEEEATPAEVAAETPIETALWSEPTKPDGENAAETSEPTAPEETAPEKTLGPPPEGAPVTASVLPSAIGLVWRALLFWMLVVLLLTIAYWM